MSTFSARSMCARLLREVTSVISWPPESMMEFHQGERRSAPRWEGTSSMKYMAAVLLLVAAMSAQNAPSTNKGGRLDIPAISREANGAIVSIVLDIVGTGGGQ